MCPSNSETDLDIQLEHCESRTRVDDRGRYLFDSKQHGRGKRNGRLHTGITEDDETVAIVS